MKKNVLYLALAVLAGLLIGFVIFGEKESGPDRPPHDHSGEMGTEQMWTCTMHPQIMQPEPGDCPICGMELVPASTSDHGLTPSQFQLSENAIALANIRTMVLGESEAVSRGLTLSGKIMENEEANQVQSSYFAGRIERLYVNVTGEQITKGQLLASIYSPELVAAQQELITAARLKTSQPGLYKAVRNKLKLWKLTDTQIDAIEESAEVRENFPVHATVSGTVTEKLVQEGDYVAQGQPLLRIADLTTVWAVFDAYEHQLALLKEGQPMQITARALPDKKFTGKINLIDPVIDSKRRTVEVRTDLKNQSGELKPGMFVTARIEGIGDYQESAIMVPATAVMWTGERSLVYVRPSPGKPIFEMRDVQLGAGSGDMEQVISGLRPGEEIVINGTFTVDAAAQLMGKKSMMNPQGGATMTGHEGHDMTAAPLAGSKNAPVIDSELRAALPGIIPAYLALKDALVRDEKLLASRAATAFSASLAKLPKAAGVEPSTPDLQKVAGQAEAIAAASELAAQRRLFAQLNQSLIPVIKTLGAASKTLFIQHCPMADNNQGAYWLSQEKEVRNPYYGESMLTCGSVVDSIK